MTFDDLNKIMEEAFGSMKLSDIARELNVTPQVVSNWKARNQVPYKYVKILRKNIEEQRNNNKEKLKILTTDIEPIIKFSEDNGRIVIVKKN